MTSDDDGMRETRDEEEVEEGRRWRLKKEEEE